jgi:uncharacterized membrane protein
VASERVPAGKNEGERGASVMNVLTNMMNWDPVAWMSILMVVIAIVIVVFLYFKVSALIKQDAEAHKNQRQ